MSGFLDRSYTAEEIAQIASRADDMMGDVPSVVAIAAHVAAAHEMLRAASAIGPLGEDFELALIALQATAELFLLVCETGPVWERPPQ